MNRRSILRWLPWIIGLALLALSIRAVSLEEIIATLRRLHWWQLGVLAIANIAVLAAFTGRWWFLLRGTGHKLPFMSVFGYRLAAFGLSYFTPGPHVGGELLQVLLVEREHDVPRNSALAAVALDKVIEFSVNFTFLLLGIAAALQWRVVPEETGRQALGLAVALLVMPLLYLAATAAGHHPVSRMLNPVARRWNRFAPGHRLLIESETLVGVTFRNAPRAFIAAVLITVIGWLLMIAEYWLMVSFLGVDMTLPQLVIALTAARIATLLLIPAGLGALEASQTMAFAAMGLDPAVGVTVGLLIRLRDTLFGAFGMWWGGRKLVSRRNSLPGH